MAPALLYVPFSHSTGSTFGLGHLKPGGHSKQLVAFTTSEYEPFAQSWWYTSFAEGHWDPIGQP